MNIGAAGTFVVRDAVAPGRRCLPRSAKRLAFDADIIIVKGRELIAFVAQRSRSARASAGPTSSGLRPMHAQAAAQGRRDLPLIVPPDDDVAGEGGRRCRTSWSPASGAVSRGCGEPLYPNAAIEKQFGVATTRNWNTIRHHLQDSATLSRLITGL